MGLGHDIQEAWVWYLMIIVYGMIICQTSDW